MAWPLVLLIFLGSFVLLMATGLPVAFCLLLLNLITVLLFFGGAAGAEQLVLSMFSSVSMFTYVAVPLFILMGDVMFHSGLAPLMIDALDKWLGRLPGRLSLLAVAAGTILAALTGSSLGSTAVLGVVLVPEMEKRGYRKSMSLGPILAAGGLAVMIPPSALAVILGGIAEIPVGKILIGSIVPGLLMAALYAAYIILRCWLRPSLAPAYEIPPVPISEKLTATIQYVLPLGFIVFLVVGVIFLGVATPSEAAATGAIGTFILAACYRRLNWKVVKKTSWSTLDVTIMIFMIIATANSYGQILAFTGAGRGLAEFALGLPVPPVVIILVMQVVGIILGMFMSVVPIMLICLPIFVPIVLTLGFDPVWFAVIFLLNMEMGTISPPFGLGLFVMKGAATPDTTLGDCFRAAMPFLYLDAIAMALIIAFPPIVIWLPSIIG